MYVIEKSYYFSRILRQFFNNLVIKKSQIQNLDILPGQLSSKQDSSHQRKKRTDFPFEWNIFLPCYNYGRKVKSEW